MKKIPLSRGLFAIVDDEDFGWLMQWKWYARAKRAKGVYCAARSFPGGCAYMHRELMRCPAGMVVDHINHDTLYNRRINLRIATKGQNRRNRKKSSGSSLYKGVHWQKKAKKWASHITCDGKTKYLGSFFCQQKAAKAYDSEARLLYKEFACVNFPKTGEQGCLI